LPSAMGSLSNREKEGQDELREDSAESAGVQPPAVELPDSASIRSHLKECEACRAVLERSGVLQVGCAIWDRLAQPRTCGP